MCLLASARSSAEKRTSKQPAGTRERLFHKWNEFSFCFHSVQWETHDREDWESWYNHHHRRPASRHLYRTTLIERVIHLTTNMRCRADKSQMCTALLHAHVTTEHSSNSIIYACVSVLHVAPPSRANFLPLWQTTKAASARAGRHGLSDILGLFQTVTFSRVSAGHREAASPGYCGPWWTGHRHAIKWSSLEIIYFRHPWEQRQWRVVRSMGCVLDEWGGRLTMESEIYQKTVLLTSIWLIVEYCERSRASCQPFVIVVVYIVSIYFALNVQYALGYNETENVLTKYVLTLLWGHLNLLITGSFLNHLLNLDELHSLYNSELV